MNNKIYIPIVFFSLIFIFIINLICISNFGSKKIYELNILKIKNEKINKEKIILDSSLYEVNIKAQDLESQIRTLECHVNSIKQVPPKKIVIEKIIPKIIKDTIFYLNTYSDKSDSSYVPESTMLDASTDISLP